MKTKKTTMSFHVQHVDLKLKEKFKSLCIAQGLKLNFVMLKLIEQYVKEQEENDQKHKQG